MEPLAGSSKPNNSINFPINEKKGGSMFLKRVVGVLSIAFVLGVAGISVYNFINGNPFNAIYFMLVLIFITLLTKRG